MMNRIAFESISSGRRASAGSQLQQFRGGKITGGGGDPDDTLDLFTRTRSSSTGGVLISPSSNRSDTRESIKLDRISVGSTRIGKGMEDLLDAEIGKHDYDWLLTPPETPLYPCAVARESPLSSTVARESPLSSMAPKGRSTARSVSNTRPSRLSASQTENDHSTRPVRSSSVTRPSISSTYSRSSFSNSNNRTSVLNTSSASVTSSRPSTPSSRSTTARPSTTSTTARSSSTSTTARPSSISTTARPSSTSRSGPSRLPTPTRTRPNPTSSGDRTIRPSNNSRPSTPTSSRPQTPSNPNPNLNSRSNSRASTPTHRPTSSAGSTTSIVGGRFPSAGRISSVSSRNQAAPAAPASRPSSPGPRARAPVRPIDLPDFPIDAPPNLRTKLPERPASAGRTRPGMALIVRANANSDAAVPAAAAVPVSSNRRNYMPVVTRGRFPENPPKAATKLHGNNVHEAASAPEIQKPAVLDSGLRRPTKPASATESTGFGRTISKKSLDMALRHMDIRQGMGGIRASSLFPQSIRSAATKGRPVRKSDLVVPMANDEALAENGSCNGTISPDCSLAPSENGDFAAASKSPDRESLATRESELDLHGSSRYDAFLLKEEDSNNMNWLHSIEDKSNQSPVFDHRFEPLPEPFGLL